MRPSASFSPQARVELKEAAAYYGLESDALRERFLSAVEAALEEVLAHPEASKVIRGDVRRKPLQRFPYALLYDPQRGSSNPCRDAPAQTTVLLVGAGVERRSAYDPAKPPG